MPAGCRQCHARCVFGTYPARTQRVCSPVRNRQGPSGAAPQTDWGHAGDPSTSMAHGRSSAPLPFVDHTGSSTNGSFIAHEVVGARRIVVCVGYGSAMGLERLADRRDLMATGSAIGPSPASQPSSTRKGPWSGVGGRIGSWTRTGCPHPLTPEAALVEARRLIAAKLRRGYAVQACSWTGLLELPADVHEPSGCATPASRSGRPPRQGPSPPGDSPGGGLDTLAVAGDRFPPSV